MQQNLCLRCGGGSLNHPDALGPPSPPIACRLVSNETAEQPSPHPFKRRGLLSSRVQGSPVDPTSIEVLAPAERKAAMQSVDRNERQVAVVASIYAVAMSLLGFAIFPNNRLVISKPTRGTSCSAPDAYDAATKLCGHLVSTGKPLVLGATLVFGIIVGIAAFFRKRILATFGGLMAGVAFSGIDIMIGFPLLIFGGWLFLRARRVQKYGTSNSREVAVLAAEDRRARKSGERPTKAMTAAEYRTHLAEKKSERSATTSGVPDPSKRYTPKSAPKKKATPEPREKPPSKWRARLEGLDKQS